MTTDQADASSSNRNDLAAFSLQGRVALVTGASSGIGQYLAGVLARAGATVALAARRKDKVDQAAAQLCAQGQRAIGVALDVSQTQTYEAAFEAIERAFGTPPDLLLNCAGVIVTKPFLEQSEDEVSALFDTNLRGAFFIAQRAARSMVALGRGSIINVASTSGVRPGGYLSSYGASKAGLIHLTKVMAFELARHGIRANVLCPGNIETEMHQDFVERGFTEALVKRIPQRRFGECADLAGAALLLASDAGRYMTGTVLTVDGGQLVNSI
jgi:NAD(P)-dependent dehydrogenase (short-subunit alcohol dehydrogenase family)